MKNKLENLDNLTFEQKAGQIIIGRPPKNSSEKKETEKLLKKGLIGGFYIPASIEPEKIKAWQEISPVPLFIATDLESNFNSNLIKYTPLPKSIVLGAIDEEKIAYKWAKIAGMEAIRAGINYVFGPVLDISLCYESVLGCCRNFSSNPEVVAKLGCAVIRGYQDCGLQVAAKHFPGAGSDIPDPHMKMHKINVSKKELIKNEIYPYKEAVEKAGLNGVMTGHIMVPAIDKKFPATLSKKILNILKEINFDGLIITDSLGMKGLKLKFSTEENYLLSLLAGHHLILSDYEISNFQSIELIKKLVKNKKLPLSVMENSVRKIIKHKKQTFEKINLLKNKPIDYEENKKFSISISKKALTSIPYGKKFKEKIEVLVFAKDIIHTGRKIKNEMASDKILSPERFIEKFRQRFPDCKIITLSPYPSQREIERVLSISSRYKNIVFIGEAYEACYKGTASFSEGIYSIIDSLEEKLKCVIVLGNPWALPEPNKYNMVVFAYEDGFTYESVIDFLSGKIKAEGKIPVPIRKANKTGRIEI